jgi:hypothetical protein
MTYTVRGKVSKTRQSLRFHHEEGLGDLRPAVWTQGYLGIARPLHGVLRQEHPRSLNLGGSKVTKADGRSILEDTAPRTPESESLPISTTADTVGLMR